MLAAIVGINWGDEGKGRMVDLFGGDFDIICRYQGGNNAGHTVKNPAGTFVLNLLPSGILRENTVNVMGCGMVVDLEHLAKEVDALRQRGIRISPANLKIAEGATICMPYHRLQDVLEEERLGAKAYGSTRRGIAPVYADKYMKKTLRMEDLFDEPASLEEKIRDLVAWKNLTVAGYGHEPVDADGMIAWVRAFGEVAKPYVCDVSAYLHDAMDAGKNIMFEAQLGALRDIDFGIYPYTSSSTTLASYAPIGAGVPCARLDRVIGIMKAYSTCVGEGSFTVEMAGEEAEALRAAGGEYGAATGRPRRVGAFDVVASRYGVRLQGADELALTKLDVLSYMDEIPVCVAYEVDGVRTEAFPLGERLERAKPVYEMLPGFGDVGACRTWEELPVAARAYVEYVERAVGCAITYVSVGAERDAIIRR